MTHRHFFVFLAAFFACGSPKPPENPAVWGKVKLDFKKIAQQENGADYEFCIPADIQYWKKVSRIDKTARKMTSKGRVGCSSDQWLVVGNTRQENYQRVLYSLASLPFVKVIQETYWE